MTADHQANRVNVAIDASSAVSGGGITYLRHILPHLLRQPSINTVALLVRPDTEVPEIPPDILIRVPGRLAARSSKWKETVRERQAEVVFAPTELSLTRYKVPLVLALRNPNYDPRLPWEYSWRKKPRVAAMRARARKEAQRAAGFIAVSDYATSIGQEVLGIPKAKIQRIYHGGPPIERQPASLKRIQRFLSVSDFHTHKNFHRAIQALADVPGDWTLEIVGRAVNERYVNLVEQTIKENSLSKKVRLLGPMSADQVMAAYDQADCLLWPSYAETFGHPLVEAHSRGLAILAAAAASNVEIAGNAATYFDPLDVTDIRRAIKQALEGGIRIDSLPRVYDWKQCARETAEYLVKIATSNPQARIRH